MVNPLGKLGVSRTLLGSANEWDWPVHGLRHPPAGDTSGWYCWTGDATEDSDFFVPSHASHLIGRWPTIEQYLMLPPGTRFVLSPDYADVWEDTSLLDV